ncbi:MAG TPA: FAD-binding and (Fe-S)-binding domain-containing protein [Bryobacteraceae bacterium]|nr:FAD-binding and (Fe-S)-binding domain-containing protein [Bryobacteraceae bacterium]
MDALIHPDQIETSQHRTRPGDQPAAYAHDLARELHANIEGEVRFDDGSRALYSTDGSNYRQVPIGVVVPKSIEDVIRAVALCRKFGAPVLARGGGTSLAGQCCNVAVVFDFTKYLNRIVSIDPEAKRARVQPGVVLDWLRDAAGKHGLTFGPDPATHNHNVLGGMIGNNSCGIHSVMAGKTEENVEELDILTYDGCRMTVGATSDQELEQIIRAGGRRGEIYQGLKRIRDKYADLIRQRYPDIPRRVSGYNLNELLPENGFNVARALVGTESTCTFTLEAAVRLVHNPPARSLLVLGYPDIFTAGDHVPEVMHGKPIGCEAIDHMLIENMKVKGLDLKDIKLLPDGKGWLLVEFGGETKRESDQAARHLMASLIGRRHEPSMKLFDDAKEEEMVWQVREAGLGATAWVPGEHVTWEGWEDSAVPPNKVGAYLRDLKKVYDKHGYEGALYGHFGQGCIHTRVTFDFETAEGIQNYRSFMEEATDLVVRYGGSISGEHGDGQSKAEFLSKMFGEELVQAFREFKSLWDPDWKMNPGKIVNPYRIDENLRLGTDYRPSEPFTHFHYMQDDGSFSQATLRCVGVGECRRHHKGTMCPSYRATMEEMHSTRGRAHLLFEMMQGEVIKDGWQSDAVFDSLDLCLSCKGCKGDCPVNVDIATYKAEFLSHYYEDRRRPRHAYSMGLIQHWARLASFAPGLVNLLGHAPGISDIVKAAAEIAPQRSLPRFAPQTFQSWFRNRPRQNMGGPQVILWADTFNNYFHPAVAAAAVEVLESAGFHVLVPRGHLCCGRPLYDFGMLDRAEATLRNVIGHLRTKIESGVSMVGLEPSCVAVFRDELIDLFPHDEDAKRLHQQTFTLAEFLEKKAPEYLVPGLSRKAMLHGHCHQKAIMGLDHEENVLRKMGVQVDVLDDGCCGMAGSFGFVPSKYEISMKVGELGVLPKVREAEKDCLVIADGFSCKTQIEQATDRQALHLAQVMQMALQRGAHGTQGEYPEREWLDLPRNDGYAREMLLAGAGLAAGGALLWALKRSRA